MIIPGFLVAWATFPGVIVHESAHLLFCKLRRVAVFDVCFFRFGNPAGYVVHETPHDFLSAFLISLGPLFVNTLLCFVICFPAFVPIRVFEQSDWLCYVLLWLGVSIGMHAFPSNQDALVLWSQAKLAIRHWNPLAILSVPLIGLVFVANIGSIFWLDYIYGLAVGLGLPEIVLKALAV